MLRILFQNPQGLGKIHSGGQSQSLKITKLKDIFLKHNIDVLGLSEVNKGWQSTPQSETLWAGKEGLFEYRRLITSINQKVQPMSQTQFGGMAIMAINKYVYSIVHTEEDEWKLG
jgi:hypothetical protein